MANLIFVGIGLLFIASMSYLVVVFFSFVSVIKNLKTSSPRLLMMLSGVYLVLTALKLFTVQIKGTGTRIFLSYYPSILNKLNSFSPDETLPYGLGFSTISYATGHYKYIDELDFLGSIYPTIIMIWWISTLVVIPALGLYFRMRKTREDIS